MPEIMKLTVEEVKEKFGHRIPEMLHNVRELADTLDEIKANMVADGRLKIVNGENVWLK